ncbi:MAG: hypothetical protein HOK52_12900, partial [Candidatus Marinimicrobia bacterium]|nr:hypothetical protein [Candidatus Neomarinimicrobiota bacterium]MBT5069316.1 hypothetical protein [Candidatus Neomarinimicrobiota bacterium]MBT5758941.1 hypothetical protein [Candidatus Neomarinimicrobiota bacterium]MBT6472139.1 hypothetical protein [Candidatus Neomarinimicrobiota bacterium]
MKKGRFLILITILFVTSIYSQGTIEGSITDETGSAISGANVYIGGSDIGSISGDDGSYKLTALPEGELVLVVDFI